MRSVKRALLVGAGCLSLGLGVIGILIPVLPTTPLLLLASFFFLKSSHRLHTWLLTHRLLGPYIYQWQVNKAISLHTKVGALALLWVGVGISIILVASVWIDLLLVVVLIAVSVHLIRMRTMQARELQNAQEDYRDYCIGLAAQ